MIKIALVDDHTMFRDDIASLLSNFSDLKVIASIGSGEESVQLIRKNHIDVMVMDLSMPGIGGIEATQRIAKRYPKTKIIILTQYISDPLPSQLLNIGAFGYLSKESKIEELVEAIRSVHTGKHYVTSKIAERLALKNILGSSEMPFDRLSTRELQVAMKVVQAEKVESIAKKLNLSPKTINSIRYRIFTKLGISSDIELVHLIVRLGLLKLQPLGENTTLHMVRTEEKPA